MHFSCLVQDIHRTRGLAGQLLHILPLSLSLSLPRFDSPATRKWTTRPPFLLRCILRKVVSSRDRETPRYIYSNGIISSTVSLSRLGRFIPRVPLRTAGYTSPELPRPMDLSVQAFVSLAPNLLFPITFSATRIAVASPLRETTPRCSDITPRECASPRRFLFHYSQRL